MASWPCRRWSRARRSRAPGRCCCSCSRAYHRLQPVRCRRGGRYCDGFVREGLRIVDGSLTRSSHALAANGSVWLVDPIDRPDAVDRALALGKPAGVIQLLDRHDRDCTMLAERLGVTHVVAPDALAGSPFTFVPVMRWRRWRESALWWPDARRGLAVTADALGTNRFYTAGKAPVAVHLLLRLTRRGRSASSSRSTSSSVTAREYTARGRRRRFAKRYARAGDYPVL